MAEVFHTKREILAAAETPKESYPFDTTCANCENVWGAHLGRLCPALSPIRFRMAQQEFLRLTALGILPPEGFQRNFKWRGSFFVPLLDCNEVGREYFLPAN